LPGLERLQVLRPDSPGAVAVATVVKSSGFRLAVASGPPQEVLTDSADDPVPGVSSPPAAVPTSAGRLPAAL
jgi:hypothetical protein